MENNYEKDNMVNLFEGIFENTSYLDELKDYNISQVNNLIDQLRVKYNPLQIEYEMLCEDQRELSNTDNLTFSELEKILQDVALVEFDLTNDPKYSMTEDELENIKKNL